MTHIIGVRQPGEARIAFASTMHTISVGQSVVIETPTETITATVVIAADQLPERIPSVEIVGTATPAETSPISHQATRSAEDERYRARKARLPVLGEQLPDGIVIRIDLRHETFAVRDERGEITTIASNDRPHDLT